MDNNPAWVPGRNTTPPGSIRGARDIALGLRALAAAARAGGSGDSDEALNTNLVAGRLLGGVGIAAAIADLQRGGQLPACGTPEWDRLVELAETGQVSIVPVLVIGDRDYACHPVVEERIGRVSPVPAPPPPKKPAPKPVSLADEIASWGPLR